MTAQSTTLVENPVRPKTHGLGAHLIFDEHGLSPYYGLVSVFEPDLDEQDIVIQSDEFEHDFELEKSSFWRGKLADPTGEIDGGMYEYSLGVWSDDEIGQRGIDVKLRPGFPNAEHVETGDSIGGIPDDCPESIRLQVEASNLEPEQVLSLLRNLFDALDLNPDYISKPGEWSRIYKLETYVRVARGVAIESLIGADGILEQLAAFGNGDSKGQHHWDHEEITGHYEHVALDPDTWSALLGDHDLGKFVKCYQPEHVRNEENDSDPLYNHKLETRYWSDYHTESILWRDVDDALQELRATALNVLDWSGISIAVDSDHFKRDSYFHALELEECVDVVSNPLEELKDRRLGDARDQLVSPDATETHFAVLKSLSELGDGTHYRGLAESVGCSESTVYRAVERFDDILETDDGIVRYVDQNIRESIMSALERFSRTKDSVERSIRRVADEVNPLSRTDDGEPSPLEKWINRHGIRVQDHYRDLRLELTEQVSQYELLQILRAGLKAAEIDPMLTSKFENGYIDWVDRDGNRHNDYKIVVQGGRYNELLGIDPLR